MFKKVLIALAVFAQVVAIDGCTKDKSDEPIPETPSPENPVPDPTDTPTPPQPDGSVVINADGTTSTGVPFRLISDNKFMLNYIEYEIVNGHIEVVGCDDIEIGQTLKGHVDIYPLIVFDGIKYNVRVIKEDAFRDCKSILSIDLPDAITAIERHAFLHSSLEYIEIPNSVTSIGAYAFSSCENLTNIKLPMSLEFISEFLFEHCLNLTKIEIPNTVKGIGRGAFKSCKKLKSISIPKSVTKIYRNAFYECSNMESIYCYNVEPAANPDNYYGDSSSYTIFDNEIVSRCVLYVPKGSLNAYSNALEWWRFNVIKEF